MNGDEKGLGQANGLGRVDGEIRNDHEWPGLITRGLHERQDCGTKVIRGSQHIGEFVTSVCEQEEEEKSTKENGVSVCVHATIHCLPYIADIIRLDWSSKACWKSASSLLAMCVKVPMASANAESSNLYQKRKTGKGTIAVSEKEVFIPDNAFIAHCWFCTNVHLDQDQPGAQHRHAFLLANLVADRRDHVGELVTTTAVADAVAAALAVVVVVGAGADLRLRDGNFVHHVVLVRRRLTHFFTFTRSTFCDQPFGGQTWGPIRIRNVKLFTPWRLLSSCSG